MDIEEWFEELIELAYERNNWIGDKVSAATFMYEDYFAAGMTPLDALGEEWGKD